MTLGKTSLSLLGWFISSGANCQTSRGYEVFFGGEEKSDSAPLAPEIEGFKGQPLAE